ncbi:MAG TPA: HAD-IA family hydrolase [Patescibacteria group bacterium]|nr:HAD-IA family hydrolase [Patescibacteria group bacterium]
MSKIKAILSDSDGTLINSLYLIRHGQYEASVEYLTSIGVPRHDIPEYDVYESYINRSVGGNTRETLEATLRLLFGETHEHHLNKIDFDELDRSLQPVQDRIAPLYVHPFHGLTELFTWLGKNSLSMGIFTSGSAYHIVRHYGLALPALGYTDLYRNDTADNLQKLAAFIERVKAVYGIPQFVAVTADDVTRTKPDPEAVLKALDMLGLKPDEVVAMGDHPVDIKAARAAGVHAMGTTHGFSTAAELKEAGAFMTVDNLVKIPHLIEAHNSGKKLLF